MDQDQTYYLVTVILKQEVEEGKTKKFTEKYIVKGYSHTDVETKINKEFEGETLEFKIKTITDSNVVKVIN